MPMIGACGISCDVCGLYTKKICDGCGSGVEEISRKKVEKWRKLGKVCPVLRCAVERNIAYCSRDCDDFPCKEFKAGPYPYSAGYLEMMLSRLGK